MQVATAVRRLCREDLDGHVLVFLPGVREIRRAIDRCRAVAKDNDLLLCPLHGRLSPREQDEAVSPCKRRKIIFATNVAESSITIEGVAAVIDSGLARVPRWHPHAAAPMLETVQVSQASATQRAGRAGRTRSGRCLRLYSERELSRAPPFERPEIERVDLAELALAVRVMGFEAEDLRWLSEPHGSSLAASERLLRDLGAVADGAVTQLGRRMASFPVHPRLGRALVDGERRGVGGIIADVAAVMSEGSAKHVDVWSEIEMLDRSHRAWRASRQLRRQLGRSRGEQTPDEIEAAVGQAIVTGMRDRLAKRTKDGDLAMVDGGRARFRERAHAAVGPDGLTVVLDAMGTDGAVPTVRLALAVQSDWVLEALIDDIADDRELVWNARLGRVEQVERMRFRSLTLEESRRVAVAGEDVAVVLAKAAWESGIHHDEKVARLRARLAHAATRSDDADALDDAALQRQLAQLAIACVSLDELRAMSLAKALDGTLPPACRRALSRFAPERIRLDNGLELPVHYPPDRSPFVESYMQDFFGLAEGPTVAAEPLILHLWAPNRRAEQVTRDLKGFWREHYPAMYKRLSRRYPKHHWPQDPVHAKAVRLKRKL